MKKLISAGLAVLLALSVSACSSNEASNSSGGPDSSGNAETESIEISFMHFYSEEDRGSDGGIDSFRHVMEEWQKDHSNVTLNETTMAQTDFGTKIQALAAAEDLPDMFFVKGSWMTNFQQSNLLLPLNDIIDSYEHKDTINNSAFDACTDSEGKIYGIPNQLSVTSLVYYNAELWKQAGFDQFPDNWEDIYKAAEYFEANDIIPFALGNTDLWESESCWLSCIGDRFTGTDWTNGIIAGDTKYSFTDPDFVNAVKFMGDIAYLFNEDYNSIGNTQADEFYYCTGKAATMVEGNWAISTIDASGDEEVIANTHIALLPANEGGKGKANVTSGGYGWFNALNSNLPEGAKRDACASLLLDTGCYEMSKYLLENYGLVGTCNVTDADLSKISPLAQEYAELSGSLDGLTPTYDLLMEASVIEVMNTGMQEVLNGTKSAEDLCAEIQAEQENVQK